MKRNEKKINLVYKKAKIPYGMEHSLDVYLLADAQGTFFLQNDPEKVLDEHEQDIYFLGEPGFGSEDDIKHLEEIAVRLGLVEEMNAIKKESNYIAYPDIKKLFYLGDRLAEEYYRKNGYAEEDALRERGLIASKVYYLRRPQIFSEILEKFPNIKISIISQAGQYMSVAFDKLLRDVGYEDINVIVAPGFEGTRYTKMDSALYRLLQEKFGRYDYKMIDDNDNRINPAKETGIETKIYRPYEGDSEGTQLLEDTKYLLRKKFRIVRRGKVTQKSPVEEVLE